MNNTGDDAYRRPQVIGLEDGGFFIVYRDASNGDVPRAQRYDSSGAEVGGEIYMIGLNNPSNETIFLSDGRIATAILDLTAGQLGWICGILGTL